MIHDKQTHRDIAARLNGLQKVIAKSSKLSDDLQTMFDASPESAFLRIIGRLEEAYIDTTAELLGCDAHMLQGWCWTHHFGTESPMLIWEDGNYDLDDPDWTIRDNEGMAEFLLSQRAENACNNRVAAQ